MSKNSRKHISTEIIMGSNRDSLSLIIQLSKDLTVLVTATQESCGKYKYGTPIPISSSFLSNHSVSRNKNLFSNENMNTNQHESESELSQELSQKYL